MPRFVCVQGVPGLLVGHPHKQGREFVGKRPRSAEAIEAIRAETGKVSLVDRFDDCVEVLLHEADSGATLDKAIASGALKVVVDKQIHPNFARAVAKMTPRASDPTAGPKKAAKLES